MFTFIIYRDKLFTQPTCRCHLAQWMVLKKGEASAYLPPPWLAI